MQADELQDTRERPPRPERAERGGPPAALNPIEQALGRAFVRLGADGVRVLGLRGAHTAPRYRHGGDLDLGCAPLDLNAVRSALLEECTRAGVVVASVHRAPSMVQLQLYARSACGAHHHLCVDVHGRETCYGVPFIDIARVRSTPAAAHLPATPEPVLGALIDFLTPFLSGASLHPQYLARLELVAECHAAPLRARLGELVGTARADRMFRALRSGHPGPALQREAAGFRRSLLLRAFLKGPHRAALGFAACLWSARVRPFLRPRGRVIALLGTDGTGKTTLADRLMEELRPSFRSSHNRIVKLRPGLFPQLGRFLGKRPTESDFARPHRAKPSGRVMTCVRAGYYWLDYVLGYAARVLPLRRRNTLLIFDRWVDDWLIDPARYRMRARNPIVRLFARMAPRPDVTLVTTAPLRTVRERKQELDARESLRQLEAYEELARDREDVFIVPTAHGVDHALDAALSAIFESRPLAEPAPQEAQPSVQSRRSAA